MDALNADGSSSLHLLASAGCCEGIRLLVQHGADPNVRAAGGRSALHCACDTTADRDDLDAAYASCVSELVKGGADLDAQDDMGCTPLHVAARSGRDDCLQALLVSGARLLLDHNGDSPLHVAARCRHVECLKLLLDTCDQCAARQPDEAFDHEATTDDADRGRPPETDDTPDRATDDAPNRPPETNEADHGRPPGDAPDRATDDGPVGQHTDATSAAVAIYQRARMQKEHDKIRRLHEAAARSDGEAVTLLLSEGAWPDAVQNPKTKSTPLHVVCGTPRDGAEVIGALCDFGATLEARDHRGNTPLHAAAQSGSATSLAALLEGGADAAAANDDKNTPLHLAVAHGHADCCRLLIRYGAPLEAPDARGRTPPATAPATLPNDVLRLLDPDADMLDDDLFFDAVVDGDFDDGDAPADTSSSSSQGFRDPPLGCSGSTNPLYVSSPTTSSPHCLDPDIQRDMSRYAEAHKPLPKRSPISAAGAAAHDILLGLSRLKS